MTFIVTMRNPRTKRLLILVDDEDGRPCEYETEREATADAEKNALCEAWGYTIVEVP